MARTLSDIVGVVKDYAPWWMQDKPESLVLRGLSAVFLKAEQTIDFIVDQLVAADATGPWLAEHADEAGVEQLFVETIDQFREHVYIRARGPTPEAFDWAAQRWLDGLYLFGNHVDFVEPKWQFAGDTEGHGMFADDPQAIVTGGDGTGPKYLGWLNIPVLEAVTHRETFADDGAGGSFAGVDAFCDDAIDDPDRLIYRLIRDAMRDHLPGSRQFGVTVADTAQTVHFTDPYLYGLRGPLM